MFFNFFRNKISKKEIKTLTRAEKTLGISLVDTYKKLSKNKRVIFLKYAENYNKEHAEYLELAQKYNN